MSDTMDGSAQTTSETIAALQSSLRMRRDELEAEKKALAERQAAIDAELSTIQPWVSTNGVNGGGSKKVHWTRRPENRDKVLAQMRKAAKSR